MTRFKDYVGLVLPLKRLNFIKVRKKEDMQKENFSKTTSMPVIKKRVDFLSTQREIHKRLFLSIFLSIQVLTSQSWIVIIKNKLSSGQIRFKLF